MGIVKLIKKFFLLKLSKTTLLIGDTAGVTACFAFFHEKELPVELQNNNPFLENENN